jgi:hypothetical protein
VFPVRYVLLFIYYLDAKKENCKGEEHNELPRDPLGGRSSLSSPHQSSDTQLHCVKTNITCNHRHGRHMEKACGPPCSSICHNRKFRKQVCQYRLLVRLPLKVATVVQQIMTELSESVSEKGKIMVITKMVLNLMQQNGC